MHENQQESVPTQIPKPVSSPTSTPISKNESAIDIWRRKIDFLEQELARTEGASARFAITEQIKEAKRKIQELGSSI